MKRTAGTISAVIFSGVLYSQCVGGQSVNSFILIPEPSLLDLRDEGQDIDEQAMLDHYQEKFSNMSSEQIAAQLNENELTFSLYPTPKFNLALGKPHADYGKL